MKNRRIGWQIGVIIGPVIALLLIYRAINNGMSQAYSGRDVNVIEYIVELIAALLCVCFSIYAGSMLRRNR